MNAFGRDKNTVAARPLTVTVVAATSSKFSVGCFCDCCVVVGEDTADAAAMLVRATAFIGDGSLSE